MYEAKRGAEFGGKEMEREYRRVEGLAREMGVGLWKDIGKGGARSGSGSGSERKGLWKWIVGWLRVGRGRLNGRKDRREERVGFETPREYKSRMTELERMKK